MSAITTAFFDVGGVLLTNGWDHRARSRAAERFHIDLQEFEALHAAVVEQFETGRMSLHDYLARTVFHCARNFSREAFIDFMFGESQPFPDSLITVAEIARSGHLLLATLNNESRELNEYRIHRFGLRQYFSVFLSSCYLGFMKPDLRIYRQALDVTQRRPEECVFIDDRPENVAAARAAGMEAIRFETAAQLREALLPRPSATRS